MAVALGADFHNVTLDADGGALTFWPRDDRHHDSVDDTTRSIIACAPAAIGLKISRSDQDGVDAVWSDWSIAQARDILDR